MSERDRIAAVLEPLLQAGWVSPLAIADALIAAGVTMPEPCGEQAIDGCLVDGCGRFGPERDGCGCVYPPGHPSARP